MYLSFVDNRENVKDENSNSFVDTFILANFVGNFKKGMTSKTCQYKRHSSLNNFDILLPIFYENVFVLFFAVIVDDIFSFIFW